MLDAVGTAAAAGIGLNGQPTILGTPAGAAAVREPQAAPTAAAALKSEADGALWPKSPANLYPYTTFGIKSLERYDYIRLKLP